MNAPDDGLHEQLRAATSAEPVRLLVGDDAELLELQAAWRGLGTLLPRGDVMLDVDPIVAKAVAAAGESHASSARRLARSATHESRSGTHQSSDASAISRKSGDLRYGLIALAALALIGATVALRMQPPDVASTRSVATSPNPANVTTEGTEFAWDDGLDDEIAAAGEHVSELRADWRMTYTPHDSASEQAESLQLELDSGAL